MTPKVFTKLLALFVLLLVFQTVVMEFVFGRLVESSAGESFHLMAHEALWAGIIALLLALPLAAWAARRVTRRIERVVSFARRVAEGARRKAAAPFEEPVEIAGIAKAKAIADLFDR